MWNGMFSPSVRKSIGTVTFVPLSRMSARDWDWLDYDNLREVAANRIATTVVKGKLVGFFRVTLVQKAGPMKNEYLWPADENMLSRYDFPDEGATGPARANPRTTTKEPDFFRYEPDEPVVEAAVMRLDSVRRRLSNATPLMRSALATMIARSAQVAGSGVETAEASEIENRVDSLGLEHLEGLVFNLATMLYWYAKWTGDEQVIDDALDELSSVETSDEAFAWIAGYEIKSRQIAAGRGLTSKMKM